MNTPLLPAEAFASAYLGRLRDVLATIDPAPIGALIDALLETRRCGGTVYLCGNGGSSATAQHFASDLLITVRASHQPFRAVCLSDNVAAMTAVANDYGYDQIFTVPLAGRIGKGDLLIAISASGNSPNIVNALRFAADAGARTAALVGFDGGKAVSIANITVHIPTPIGEYGAVEDVHSMVKHIVAAYLTARLRDVSDPRGEGELEPKTP